MGSSDFADVEWDAVRLRFTPAMLTRRATTNVSDLWWALSGGTGRDGEMLAESHALMVSRRGFVSCLRTLDTLEYEPLEHMRAHGTFAARCEMLIARFRDNAGVAKAGALLADWIGSELITGIDAAACPPPNIFKEISPCPRILPNRRALLLGAVTGLAGLGLASLPTHAAAKARAGPRASRTELSRLPIRQLTTDVLDIGYHAAGPEGGRPVVLVHDFGYDIHSFVDVVPRLAADGYRVLMPHLRGHGSTRFKNPATQRSAEQAAFGMDLIDFIDALHTPEAVFAGIGWGAHAVYAAMVIRPSRCVGVVLSGNGRIDEATLWHQYYFRTDPGKVELPANRRHIARTL